VSPVVRAVRAHPCSTASAPGLPHHAPTQCFSHRRPPGHQSPPGPNSAYLHHPNRQASRAPCKSYQTLRRYAIPGRPLECHPPHTARAARTVHRAAARRIACGAIPPHAGEQARRHAPRASPAWRVARGAAAASRQALPLLDLQPLPPLIPTQTDSRDGVPPRAARAAAAKPGWSVVSFASAGTLVEGPAPELLLIAHHHHLHSPHPPSRTHPWP
jgi:hypothetical protein